MIIDNLEAEHETLAIENKDLKSKVQVLENAKIEIAEYLSKMEEISVSMAEELKNLKSSVVHLSEANGNQNVDWKCNRIVCSKDHTFLIRKINEEIKANIKVFNQGGKRFSPEI